MRNNPLFGPASAIKIKPFLLQGSEGNRQATLRSGPLFAGGRTSALVTDIEKLRVGRGGACRSGDHNRSWLRSPDGAARKYAPLRDFSLPRRAHPESHDVPEICSCECMI